MTAATCDVDVRQRLLGQYQEKMESLRTELMEEIPNVEDRSSVDKFLANSELDDRLALFVVLKEATPKGLAEFAAMSSDDDVRNETLVEQLLSQTKLMKQMVLADGAKAGKYGEAMKIYSDIKRERSMEQCPVTTVDGFDLDEKKRNAPVLERLAIAIALEHAVPIKQENPKSCTSGNAVVDPVQRYLNYELAFLQGELDPSFCELSVWLLRMVVDGEEPDETIAWGRTMLRNYRPDHVLSKNEEWKYVSLVRTSIRYGSQHVKYDRDELQRYQNILMNGGVCGRRAFIGRFILRAFGIPTAGWGSGWTKGPYGPDEDFLNSCQARDHLEGYWKVKRAQWIGDVAGERRVYGKQDKKDHGFWNAASLSVQQKLLDSKKKPSGRLDKEENYGPTISQQISSTSVSPNAKKVSYEKDGREILIPAASFEGKPKAKEMEVMTSFKGGQQVYLAPFQAQGVSILRGGTWKSTADAGCSSGSRLKSGGYGKYNNWGFRVALSDSHCQAKPDSNGNYPPSISISICDKSNINLEMIYIKPGKFTMGGEGTKDDRFACVEVPKHEVEITKGFYIGKYPVTQSQYKCLMGKNPSGSTKGDNLPVDNIAETDASDFCDRFMETVTYCMRLPTEAEWEYAVRAGSNAKWFFGDDPTCLGEYAWHKDNAGGKSHPVGKKKPNPWGLYDVYGNVCERVSDKYGKDFYKKSPAQDPEGPKAGTSSIFKYKFKAATAGVFMLSVEVCTVNYKQQLSVSADGSTNHVIELPFTCGEWQFSEPVLVSLTQGENVLSFWRENPPQYGVVVSTIRLTYAENQALATA